MYDDILKKYDIPKRRLFFIIDEPDEKKISFEVRQAIKGIREIRKRHSFIVSEYRRRRGYF
jgi:hypothetical protein